MQRMEINLVHKDKEVTVKGRIPSAKLMRELRDLKKKYQDTAFKYEKELLDMALKGEEWMKANAQEVQTLVNSSNLPDVQEALENYQIEFIKTIIDPLSVKKEMIEDFNTDIDSDFWLGQSIEYFRGVVTTFRNTNNLR